MIGLFCCRFYLQLSSFFHYAPLFVAHEEIIWFLVLKLYFRCVFSLLFSGVFSNVIRDSKRTEILLFSVLFCPPKSIINSFLCVQFSWLLLRGKGKTKFLVFSSVIIHLKLSSFCWYFFKFWSVICSTLNKQCLKIWSYTWLWLLGIWFIFLLTLALKYFKKTPGN